MSGVLVLLAGQELYLPHFKKTPEIPADTRHPYDNSVLVSLLLFLFSVSRTPIDHILR